MTTDTDVRQMVETFEDAVTKFTRAAMSWTDPTYDAKLEEMRNAKTLLLCAIDAALEAAIKPEPVPPVREWGRWRECQDVLTFQSDGVAVYAIELSWSKGDSVIMDHILEFAGGLEQYDATAFDLLDMIMAIKACV